MPWKKNTCAWIPVLAAALVGLSVLGCDSSTEPEQVLTFSGTVTFATESFHSFSFEEEGTTRIDLVQLDPVLIDSSQIDPAGLNIQIGVGFEVDGECQENVSFTVVEGGTLFFSLVPQTYCVSVFDGGQLVEDATLAYTIMMELP